MRRLTLIVNPCAGGGRALRALGGVQSALSGRGQEHDVQLTRSLDHACALALAAAEADSVAVAFGGDGLIGAVAGALKHSEGVVGLLPGGRGNDFARVLGIPLDPVAACEVLRWGVVRKLDLGEAESRTFIGIASCGFDSQANRIANQSRFRGNLVYAYAALRALRGWQAATFRVRLDGGEDRAVIGYTVAAANSGSYGGGMLLAPDASLQDGLLDVVMISRVGKLRFLALLPTVFKGRHVRQPEVEVAHAREVELSADRPFMVYADGDPIAELPAVVRALPGAVRVMVPREYGGGSDGVAQ